MINTDQPKATNHAINTALSSHETNISLVETLDHVKTLLTFIEEFASTSALVANRNSQEEKAYSGLSQVMQGVNTAITFEIDRIKEISVAS